MSGNPWTINKHVRPGLSGLLILVFLLLPAMAPAQDLSTIQWTDATAFGIHGQAWSGESSNTYARLPDQMEGKIPAGLMALGQHSAGLNFRFQTNSDSLFIRWVLPEGDLALPHMPATGVSGLDVYVLRNRQWRWLANGRPLALQNELRIRRASTSIDTFLVYLPLYNRVDSLQVGTRSGSLVDSVADEMASEPVVVYGSSITQGCCASRPGMAYPALLSRMFMRDFINLGFSGSCRMETAMADLIAEIDAAVYLIDCLPNMNAALVEERAVPFLSRLRTLRPDTPIVLAEDRTYADAWYRDHRAFRNESAREALRDAYKSLESRGFNGIWYVEGEAQLGKDGEDTVDGSHPTDLGFYRQSRYFARILSQILDTMGQ